MWESLEHLLSTSSFQQRVSDWIAACFPPSASLDRNERTHRFLEEALELAQGSGCSRSEALALVDYVYGRPEGKAELEVGGVMVTLAGLCGAFEIDMEIAGETELKRNWDRIEAIRAKQASKPHGSSLPQ